MNETLATELISMAKSNAKRWFMAFLVVLCLWFATIGGFLVYFYLPTDGAEAEIYSDNGNANYVGNDVNGVLNNGGMGEGQDI